MQIINNYMRLRHSCKERLTFAIWAYSHSLQGADLRLCVKGFNWYYRECKSGILSHDTMLMNCAYFEIVGDNLFQ